MPIVGIGEGPDRVPYPNVTAIIRIDRTRIIDDDPGAETTAYYMASQPDANEAQLPRLAQACRCHWSIENGLHWVRDVAYREDQSQRYIGNLPVIFAACYSICIAAARRLGVPHATARTELTHNRKLVGLVLGVGLEV